MEDLIIHLIRANIQDVKLSKSIKKGHTQIYMCYIHTNTKTYALLWNEDKLGNWPALIRGTARLIQIEGHREKII